MMLTLPSAGFSALIFDCDGTLVDTAPAHLRAVQAALDPLKLSMEPAWYHERGGLTPKALWDDFEAEMGGIMLDRKSLSERYSAAFADGLEHLREVAVTARIARAWRGRVPMAVASNGRRKNVEASLAVTNLLPLFDYVVTADDVENGKPEPDVFLEAARLMGVEAAECLVFEDSNEGLEAARRAGMRSIDVREASRAAD